MKLLIANLFAITKMKMIADPASLSISRARSMNGAQWTALLNSLPKSSSFQKNSNKFYLKVSQFWASSILQKKTNRKFNFYCNGVLCIMYYYGQTVFVCLLRELKTPNRRFKIKRPLSTKHFKIGSGFKILTKALLQEMDVPSSVNFFKPDGSRRRARKTSKFQKHAYFCVSYNLLQNASYFSRSWMKNEDFQVCFMNV